MIPKNYKYNHSNGITGRHNFGVWVVTTRKRQYVYYRVGSRKQRYLGPIDQVREIVDRLNAMGVNKAGIPFTSEDIKLVTKAKEMMAAAEAAMKEAEAKKKEAEAMMQRAQEMMQQAREMMRQAQEWIQWAQGVQRELEEAKVRERELILENIKRLQEGLEILRQGARFGDLGGLRDSAVARAIASAACLVDDRSAISRMLNFLATLDWVFVRCEEKKIKGCKDFKNYLVQVYGREDALGELYKDIKDDLERTLARVKKHYRPQDADQPSA
ncbi:MAG: hypothetical protein JZD41_00790 [Thermoproteus sp.]|nr:hypothetical protein [Thermoproteus sp.]